MRKLLFGAAAVLFAWGIVVAATGGVDVRIGHVALRSRDPFRALVLSLLLAGISAVVYRRAVSDATDRSRVVLQRAAPWAALALGLLLAAHAIGFGAFAVGGADSYGYVNQAYDWVSGRLPRLMPIPLSLPLETSDRLQTPLGYRVAPQPHTMVPTYAPGLPLLMAAALLVAGSCGPYFVVPVCAALFVWFTYRLGLLGGGRIVGLVAALVLVTSPVVLYQALWPMSDVPVGALWTGALTFAFGGRRRDAAIAGGLAAIALLVRPNLVFVPAVPLLALLTHPTARERWLRAALFCAPVVPVVAAVAVLNTMWYGAPSNSGYGTPQEIYQAANVVPNVKLYASWLWASQSPWVLLALLPLAAARGGVLGSRVLAACVLIAAATLASYVTYAQFEVWWYLRFLLPAFGALAVLLAGGLVVVARALPQPFGRLVATVALGLMIVTTLRFAAGKYIFGELRSGERRYVDVAEYIDASLPEKSALIAMQHSGGLRFYTGRLTVRFDWIYKQWAAEVVPALEGAGYHPYLVVDDVELPSVREHFGLAPESPLPWPVRARMRELGGVTVFDLATHVGGGPPVALEPGSRHLCAPRHVPVI